MRRALYLMAALTTTFVVGASVGGYYTKSQGPGTVMYLKRSHGGTVRCPDEGPGHCGYEEQRHVFLGEWDIWVDNNNPSESLNIRDRNDLIFTVTKPTNRQGFGKLTISHLPFDLNLNHQPVLQLVDVDNKGNFNHISYSSWIEKDQLMIAKDLDMNGVIDKRTVIDHSAKRNAP